MTEAADCTESAAADSARSDPSPAPVARKPSPPPSAITAFANKAKDLQALCDAVVDAATVGGGLWFSYLFVLLYLLIAVGGVSHRDLFFESRVKLPFLNVDLPLVGFFALGPAIFLIVHAYVLLHFVLLAGKVGAFNAELQAQIADKEVRGWLRRQLPSNIFVQFLAGPRGVRTGATGFMLRLIAQISLVIGPIALLVFFELQFLAYHDEVISWWHRIALLADLALLWMLWPPIARGEHAGLTWSDLRRVRIMALAFASLVPALLVTTIATFPGEWLENRLPSVRFIPWKEGKDEPWRRASLHELLVAGDVDFAARKPKSLWSNRLVLPGLDAIDHSKFDSEAKIEGAPETASLRARHLEGAVLINATLRKADFTAAQLQGAQLDYSDLRGAKFECDIDEGPGPQCVQLQRASLQRAQLQGASLDGAQLQGAMLTWARLQGASLNGAQLQGAELAWARLQGAKLDHAHLQGAVLSHAYLDGASLDSTQLQGAWLDNAGLSGARLEWTQLQGARLDHAYLEGASLYTAELQGASLDGARLEGASFRDVFVWRADARKANWKNTRVVDPKTGPKRAPEPAEFRAAFEAGTYLRSKQWSAESFEKLKKMVAEEVPESAELRSAWQNKAYTVNSMTENSMTDLTVKIDFEHRRSIMAMVEQRLDPARALEAEGEMAKVWEAQARSSPAVEVYEKNLAEIWRRLGCDDEGAPYAIRALLIQLRLVSSPFEEQSLQPPKIALTFLDEEHCPGARGLTDAERIELKRIRDRSPATGPKK